MLSFLSDPGGANLSIKNGLGCSPLWIAAGYDRIKCLEYLIEKFGSSGENGLLSLESALLDANSTGDTPFLAAASRGNVGACRCLWNAAGKFEESTCWNTRRRMLRSTNDGGDTALNAAVASGQEEELLTLLLEADDEIDGWYRSKERTMTNDVGGEEDTALQSKCVDKINGKGLSPLIVACERNLASIAALLLKHRADLRTRDSEDRNALAVAAFCGCNDMVEFLLAHEEAKSLLLNAGDSGGRTPLWLAARTGNLSVVKLLMDAGADATIGDEEGLSPRDVAVKFKKDRVEEYFSQCVP